MKKSREELKTQLSILGYDVPIEKMNLWADQFLRIVATWADRRTASPEYPDLALIRAYKRKLIPLKGQLPKGEE